jgi:hypothetical protein
MTSASEWDQVRQLVRAKVQGDLRRAFSAVTLTGIDHHAFEAVKPWYRRERRAGWEWYDVTKRRRVHYYDLAIWHSDRLCGLAFGPASLEWVCMAYIESDPDRTHPLKGKVTDIAIAVLETQALALGVAETRLLRPLPELVPWYQKRGYERLAEPKGMDYLAKFREMS